MKNPLQEVVLVESSTHAKATASSNNNNNNKLHSNNSKNVNKHNRNLLPFLVLVVMLMVLLGPVYYHHHKYEMETDRRLRGIERDQVEKLFLLWNKHKQKKMPSVATTNNSSNATDTKTTKTKTRLLYTVTTLSEFNSGQRSTQRGSDRFRETLLPVLTESVYSLVESNKFDQVDVYLICGYVFNETRRVLLEAQLPSHVGLEVWDDALPYNYNMKDIRHTKNPKATIEPHTRGLARQHRFVLKDKLPYYDVFVNFEDDMLIHAEQVQQYLLMTNHLERLREQAPDDEDDIIMKNVGESDEEDDKQKNKRKHPKKKKLSKHHDPATKHYGPLTKQQLKQTIPGFVRVEVVLNETATPIPELQVKVPIDLTTVDDDDNDSFNDNNKDKNNNTTQQQQLERQIHIDPAPCCHVTDRMLRLLNTTTNTTTDYSVSGKPPMPKTPSVRQLITWEVQILPLGVRRMPPLHAHGLLQNNDTNDNNNTTKATATTINTNTTINNNDPYHLDWVVLQRGNQPKPEHALGDYWSGNDGYYQNDTVDWRPASHERKYINNQGGYMATQRQLWEWHSELCAGSGFLPPFDGPVYNMDGLDLRDVEYWSGGLQLATRNNACNLQRIVDLHPTHFARHILYHTANNKQAQLQHVSERFTRLDELYGMLNAVRKNAQRAMIV